MGGGGGGGGGGTILFMGGTKSFGGGGGGIPPPGDTLNILNATAVPLPTLLFPYPLSYTLIMSLL